MSDEIASCCYVYLDSGKHCLYLPKIHVERSHYVVKSRASRTARISYADSCLIHLRQTVEQLLDEADPGEDLIVRLL